MVTWNEYFKGIFEKIMTSYSLLSDLNDEPGDLNIIKRESLRIVGFFRVVLTKLESEHYPSKDLSELRPKLIHYLESYYFEREIETMADLYSEDANRIKNMRLKILESLNDNKLIQRIQHLCENL